MTRHVAVIDIGKTNAKVALVDLAAASEVALRRMVNEPVRQRPYPHHDVERLWAFILGSLAEIDREQRIDAISITTHGATAVLADASGELALPVLDYEFDGPDAFAKDYDAIRPPFTETGTPRLPAGLNLGAQLFWQQKRFPADFARAAAMLMYPQYWALRLTGVAASEVTSLGCHTDLWTPWKADFSSLVDRLEWRRLMAPVRQAKDRLGPILPALARQTGLDPQTPVYCGLHDSNASLLPHLLSDKPPFSVVSTGTWVVSMAVGGSKVTLDPARDTLVNVNAFGDAVPSARFMGGREFSVLTEGQLEDWTEDDVAAVLARKTSLLPSIQRGSGPFPHCAAAWLNADGINNGQRFVAISFYLALMTATCLDLIGGGGSTIVEGPFARNRLFTRMLAAATARAVIASAAATGTSIGAALLASDQGTPQGRGERTEPSADPLWTSYVRSWRSAVDERA
ncbi:FGGY-family carbohydrate kinase [Mesorhizobium sp. M0199]|uniref:FGGY-family carbohydrate kinase n=1 Tax=Mesorhizobium sp. M0199 TaxID=2956911 RepID=UPI003338D0A1